MFDFESNTNLRVQARRLGVESLNQEVTDTLMSVKTNGEYWLTRSGSFHLAAMQLFVNKGASVKSAYNLGRAMACLLYKVNHGEAGLNIRTELIKETPKGVPAHCIEDMVSIFAKYIDTRTKERASNSSGITGRILNRVRR